MHATGLSAWAFAILAVTVLAAPVPQNTDLLSAHGAAAGAGGDSFAFDQAQSDANNAAANGQPIDFAGLDQAANGGGNKKRQSDTDLLSAHGAAAGPGGDSFAFNQAQSDANNAVQNGDAVDFGALEQAAAGGNKKRQIDTDLLSAHGAAAGPGGDSFAFGQAQSEANDAAANGQPIDFEGLRDAASGN